MSTALTVTHKIDAALADAQSRNIIFRTGAKLWANIRDPRLPQAGKITFGAATSLAWAIYTAWPIDVIPDFLAPLLGPLFFLVLLDDLFLVPVLGISLFNWWADWYRRRHSSA